MRAPHPSDERQRLQALHDLRVVSTDRDEVLEDIVEMAAHVCGTAMAGISFVDADRQWFRTQRGFGTRGSERDRSLCGHAILAGEVFVVPDTTQDERVADAEMVEGDPHARFYAAAPLLSAEGYAIGTLCVLDRQPRALEHWQARMLQVLARQAVAHLRLNRLVGDRAEAMDDLHDARRNLSFMSTHDTLTSLLNRQAVTERLEELVTSSAAGTTTSAIVHIDLDDFDHINDTYGHAAGDRVLVTIADRIHLGARGDDSVGRLAGDEFVVVVANAASGGPEALAKRLLRSIHVPVRFDDVELRVTASIGIARWAPGMASAGDLLRAGSSALHEAKVRGGNRVVVHEGRLRDSMRRRSDVHAFVRDLVAQGRLRLEFQPLWSLETGGLVAREALLRWDASRPLDIAPGELVAVAADIGLVDEVTDFTIREACRFAAQRRAGGEPDAAVTVNVSPMQLERAEVILVVASALTDFGLDPGALVLEVTDSADLASSGQAQATVRELHTMGIRIALDDFGAGSASLALVRELPFDMMKIHGSFVVTQNEVDREVLASLVRLGHSLGMVVVAEGIEEPAVLQQLGALGCDLAQGYLLGRPAPGGRADSAGQHPLIAALHAEP